MPLASARRAHPRACSRHSARERFPLLVSCRYPVIISIFSRLPADSPSTGAGREARSTRPSPGMCRFMRADASWEDDRAHA
uniref:Uncharacterized protein n=1 Tax=uncultured marine virus TaxID=186617 RepID=A0A0F7LAH3_9VIRU|nr:hypothetical protein [uncultured marine virus]